MQLRKLVVVILFLIVSFQVFAQNTSAQTYTRPDANERFKKYLSGTIGPTALIGPVFSAGFRQIRNKPVEWEKSFKGFGKRFGDSLGRQFIRQSITYGLDEALKLDSNYYRSSKKDFGSRLSNAAISAFTARKPDGKRVIGVPRIVGTYSAAIIANEVWMPKRFSYKDGLRDGSINLVTRIGFNLLREFIIK